MEQFEQLLTCAICLDRYRNPKLLPCQHSFCMEPCMDGLVDYVRRQVKCPECRAEHRIPYQGVQAFPTNVTLQRFLELHIEITGELPDPTSGQTMERCGVCSEKSYCSHCVHCDKKCCPECKDAHMDILRREITRINSQVRRGLHRLQDALALVEKNTLGLQTNCTSVSEEIDEFYRRLTKALKDRTDYLRNEVDRYLGTELRGLVHLKENLELEISNIQSNCDLAEAHINENVPWDDAELLDAKELFLRTVEFIRNFEYEAGDYSRRVRFMLPHEPNQMVLHLAGYGELNIKPETGSGNMLGTPGGLAPPGGPQGLMRSKSDHRLASQFRQQEDDRAARNRYVPDYEYETPEYEAPRNKSRYRSRFMRQRDGEDSDGDSRAVRFTGAQPDPSGPTIPREKVLDTEDAGKGPLSGIFRLTDSPRVMLKLQECERVGKKKKEEVHATPQPQPPKPQVQVRKAPAAAARQVSEDDEISRIKKQNKNAPSSSDTTTEETLTPVLPTPALATTHSREPVEREREPEEPPRRPSVARRTSAQEAHPAATRSASSDSSTGSESSTGSGIRSTGAPFTAEEMKQKYLSKSPATGTTTTLSTAPTPTVNTVRDVPSTTTTTTPQRPFQSRFLGGGNRAAPAPPPPLPREEPPKKEEDDEEETTSSSEETDSDTEEESETENPSTPTQTSAPSTPHKTPGESAMARTDIGPLLARSAEARRGSKEDSPSTRYSSSRGSPAQSTTTTTSTPTSSATSGGYTSRFVANDDIHHFNYCSNNTLADIIECEPDEGDDSPSEKSDKNKIVVTVSDSSDKDENGASYRNCEIVEQTLSHEGEARISTDEEDGESLVINIENASGDINNLSNASPIRNSLIENDDAIGDRRTLARRDVDVDANAFDGNGWLVDSPEPEDEQPRAFSYSDTRAAATIRPDDDLVDIDESSRTESSEENIELAANYHASETTDVLSKDGWLVRDDVEEDQIGRGKPVEKLIAYKKRETSPTLGSNGWLIDSSDAEELTGNGNDEGVSEDSGKTDKSDSVEKPANVVDAESDVSAVKNDFVVKDDVTDDYEAEEDKKLNDSRMNNMSKNNNDDDVSKMNKRNDGFVSDENNGEDEDGDGTSRTTRVEDESTQRNSKNVDPSPKGNSRKDDETSFDSANNDRGLSKSSDESDGGVQSPSPSVRKIGGEYTDKRKGKSADSDESTKLQSRTSGVEFDSSLGNALSKIHDDDDNVDVDVDESSPDDRGRNDNNKLPTTVRDRKENMANLDEHDGNELYVGATALVNASADTLKSNVASEVNQSVKSDKSDESLDLGMQMQMVTTVFCVSILCYSVLINLLFV